MSRLLSFVVRPIVAVAMGRTTKFSGGGSGSMSQHFGKLVAQAGPVVVTVMGGSAALVGVATVIVAVGAAAALALAGYGIYRYLSSDGAAPMAALGDKAGTTWQFLCKNGGIREVPFLELLKMAASGEIQPTDKVRQVGNSEWVEAQAAR